MQRPFVRVFGTCALLLLFWMPEGTTAEKESLYEWSINPENRESSLAEIVGVMTYSKLKKEADAGDSKAMYMLGMIFSEGVGRNVDYEKAEYWWTRSAETGDQSAQFSLGTKYLIGKQLAFDKSKGVYWLERASKQGYSSATQYLGYILLTGERVDKNPERAAKLLFQAARQGEVISQRVIGRLLLVGHGTNVPRSGAMARYWLGRAAKQGDRTSQYLLGAILNLGYGGPREPSTSIEWLRQAAEAGHSGACAHLGSVLLNKSDETEQALRWLRRAKNAGEPEAFFELGKLYIHGVSLQRNISMGNKMLKKAAFSGSTDAQVLLAHQHEKGSGFETQNPVEQAAWLGIASSRSRSAKENFQKVFKNMDKEQQLAVEVRKGELLGQLQRDFPSEGVELIESVKVLLNLTLAFRR